ncbi:MAG: cupredoxin family protein [Caldimonas sp.]
MNLRHLTLQIAASLLLATSGHAHGNDDHGAKGSVKPDGHSHEHGDNDAIGLAGDPKRVNRTVKVGMSDSMRFAPASVAVRQGETIRFLVRNDGKIKHEMVLGTEKELKEHYELMKKFPEMEHADPQMVTVAPGKTGEIFWRFTKAGKVDFACLQPGHFDAGMKGMVNVAAGKGSATGHDVHETHKH